jgi:hypothetical protein
LHVPSFFVHDSKGHFCSWSPALVFGHDFYVSIGSEVLLLFVGNFGEECGVWSFWRFFGV